MTKWNDGLTRRHYLAASGALLTAASRPHAGWRKP